MKIPTIRDKDGEFLNIPTISQILLMEDLISNLTNNYDNIYPENWKNDIFLNELNNLQYSIQRIHEIYNSLYENETIQGINDELKYRGYDTIWENIKKSKNLERIKQFQKLYEFTL